MMWFLVLVQVAFAATPTASVEIWQTGNLYYPFVKDQKSGALISENCFLKKENCEALKAVANKRNAKISEKEARGGKNPGAVVCKKIYAGEILILKNSAGNESAFCKFKDNTQASASDLF